MVDSRKKDFTEKEIFTTYDAARICDANIASIKNWIAKGLLRAFRTPGGHFRIKRRDLELFVQKFNMPAPFQRKENRLVQLLGGEGLNLSALQSAIVPNKIERTSTHLAAALAIGLERPDLFVLDLDTGVEQSRELLTELAANPATCNIRLMVVARRFSRGQESELRRSFRLEDVLSKDRLDLLIEALHRALQ